MLTACAALLLAPLQQPPTPDAFPPSTALAEGVSPEALAELDAMVQGFVDDGEIVGAELMVIVNGNAIHHAGYGWRHREEAVPMEPGGVFCVRSMTKPITAAAAWIAIDEDLVELGDRVADYLPAYDVEGSRAIEIEHLLTHTAGFPFSLMIGRDLARFTSLQQVAELGAGYGLLFEPGTAFEYSDQGTDTLAAVLEVATGRDFGEYVAERLLGPLGMDESAVMLNPDHPLRERVGAKYIGGPGAWEPFWTPADEPLFPCFLGSQGLYATLADYAKFMDLWLDRGRVGRERILRPTYVRRTLKPGPFPLGGPTGLPGLRADYGHLMQVWTRPEADDPEEREVVAFGHSGSDGTHAWAFPDQRAIVLYFTQSRGTATGIQVEEALGELFLGVPFDPNVAAPPLEEFVGFYRDAPDDLYRAIVRDGDDLALEVIGRGVVTLVYAGEDRWKLKQRPDQVLAFWRDEDGRVAGYAIDEHREYRFEPDAGLPTADDVATKVAATHGLHRLAELGPLRRRGTLEIPSLELEGSLEAHFAWPDRFAIESVTGEERERAAFDGEHVRMENAMQPLAILEGERADQTRNDHLLAHFGDWRHWHANLVVVQRLEEDGQPVFLVRTGGTDAPHSTYYVDGSTWRLRRVDSFATIPGMGRMGQQAEFGEFETIEGMLLPAATKIELANPLVGEIHLRTTSTEVGVEVPEGTFRLE